MHAPDDVVAVPPKWPNGVDHDLGLGDDGLHRRVVPNVYSENSNFMTKLELFLEFFQFLLRPTRDGERERGGTGSCWVRVEVLGYVFPGETWNKRALQ